MQLDIFFKSYLTRQWWILIEASEAIASGPSFFRFIEGPAFFENAVCSLMLWYFTWFYEPHKLSKVWSFQQIGEMYVT